MLGNRAQIGPSPDCKNASFRDYVRGFMDDPTRGVLGSQPPEEPQNPAPSGNSGSEGGGSSIPPGGNRPSRDPKFIGDAMRSLYRSSATSIERGDATRVIGRTEADLAGPARSVPPPAKQQTTSSVPAGPRVDVTLWLVLALGLFAIAGVMLSGAL
jgi:hypothetical protein